MSLPTGRIVLLTQLKQGQIAQVLQLPADPHVIEVGAGRHESVCSRLKNSGNKTSSTAATSLLGPSTTVLMEGGPLTRTERAHVEEARARYPCSLGNSVLYAPSRACIKIATVGQLPIPCDGIADCSGRIAGRQNA